MKRRAFAYRNQALALNPHIKSPEMINPGTILRLTARPAPPVVPPPISPATLRHPIQENSPFCQPCNPVYAPGNFVLNHVPPQDEIDFWMLSWLAENSNYLLIPGSISTGAFSSLLSKGNLKLIEQIDDLYAQYKSGAISKGQYVYQRRIRLDQFKTNTGPMERLLFGDQTPHEVIRIARGGGVPATHNITSNVNRLRNLASYGKYGGYVLTGVGLAASCKQIADTDSRQEKNEILVETVTSTGAGFIAGLTVSLFLISNPVGWGTALVLAAGSAAIAYGSGKLAREGYTMSGAKVDLVSGMGLDSVCR